MQPGQQVHVSLDDAYFQNVGAFLSRHGTQDPGQEVCDGTVNERLPVPCGSDEMQMNPMMHGLNVHGLVTLSGIILPRNGTTKPESRMRLGVACDGVPSSDVSRDE